MSLGFVDTVITSIYIGGDSPTGWYFWDGEAKQENPISKTAIKCYIKKINVKETEYKGKRQDKLILTIEADKLYNIKSGIETWFSKTLLIRLTQMDIEQLSHPVIIHVKKGNEGEPIVFSTIQDASGEYIKRPTDFDYKQYKNINLLKEHYYRVQSVIESAVSRQLSEQSIPTPPVWDEDSDIDF